MLWAALCGMFAIGSWGSQVDQDPEVRKGGQLARIACSACHIVANDSESPPPVHEPALRFDEIANRPGTTEQSLQRFITTTHWDGETIPITMPRPELTKQQVVALSRYIMSQRKR
jgi:Cytochrome c